MKTTIHCWLLYGIAAVIALGGLAGCGSDNRGSSDPVQIRTLSNRADLVSGVTPMSRSFCRSPHEPAD